jgi:hypothetical protein
MMYRQEKTAEADMTVLHTGLHVDGRWWPGILLDATGKALPLPHEMKAGEHYIIEADTRTGRAKYNPAKDDPNRPRGFCRHYRSCCVLDPKMLEVTGRKYRCIGSKACEEYGL